MDLTTVLSPVSTLSILKQNNLTVHASWCRGWKSCCSGRREWRQWFWRRWPWRICTPRTSLCYSSIPALLDWGSSSCRRWITLQLTSYFPVLGQKACGIGRPFKHLKAPKFLDPQKNALWKLFDSVAVTHFSHKNTPPFSSFCNTWKKCATMLDFDLPVCGWCHLEVGLRHANGCYILEHALANMAAKCQSLLCNAMTI